MEYERKEPLPPHEDKYESFYIRYEVQTRDDGINHAVRAEVWKTCEWTKDGNPVFFNAGPGAPGIDPTKLVPLFELLTKWDSCSHLRMEYLHFDGIEEFEAFGRVVKYIYEEICARHEVGDY
jgi:hypothetical protein